MKTTVKDRKAWEAQGCLLAGEIIETILTPNLGESTQRWGGRPYSRTFFQNSENRCHEMSSLISEYLISKNIECKIVDKTQELLTFLVIKTTKRPYFTFVLSYTDSLNNPDHGRKIHFDGNLTGIKQGRREGF